MAQAQTSRGSPGRSRRSFWPEVGHRSTGPRPFGHTHPVERGVPTRPADCRSRLHKCPCVPRVARRPRRGSAQGAGANDRFSVYGEPSVQHGRPLVAVPSPRVARPCGSAARRLPSTHRSRSVRYLDGRTSRGCPLSTKWTDGRALAIPNSPTLTGRLRQDHRVKSDYEEMASVFDRHAGDSAYNAHYDRPAVLSSSARSGASASSMPAAGQGSTPKS